MTGCTCDPTHLDAGGFDPGCPAHEPRGSMMSTREDREWDADQERREPPEPMTAHVAAIATDGQRLPDPNGGCCCEPFSQSAGGGYVEHLAEYEPACPVHSEHVYNPRTGVWDLADGLAGKVAALADEWETDGYTRVSAVADLRALLAPSESSEASGPSDDCPACGAGWEANAGEGCNRPWYHAVEWTRPAAGGDDR